MPSEFVKDPDAVLDYVFDWAGLTNSTGTSDWLAAGETIAAASHTITATPVGITVNSSAQTGANTSVTVWLSGGTAGVDYRVSCEIVTSDSRTDERTMIMHVKER